MEWGENERSDQPPSMTGRTLADRAFEWLEEAIIKGVYPPESRLDEVKLAKAFGISRGPVREAIRRLEGMRLVERVAHSGVRVARRSLEDLIELLTVREALEGIACRLATQHISDAGLEDLEGLLSVHASQIKTGSGEHYFQRPGDRDFHFRIIQESGNNRLKEMLCNELYHLLRIYRYRSSAREGRAAEALEEHRQILAAMRMRDPGLAEQRMRAHLTHAREAVEATRAEPVPPRLRP